MLVANDELIKKCKELGLNISLILDAALERELNPQATEAFNKAIGLKMESYDAWLTKNPKLKEEYENDMVLEPERKGRKEIRHGSLGQVTSAIQDSRC